MTTLVLPPRRRRRRWGNMTVADPIEGSPEEIHAGESDPGDAFKSVVARYEWLSRDRETMARWSRSAISQSVVRQWVDGPLAKRWNSLSAARVWHICQSGRDARFVPPFERGAPSLRRVRLLGPVPGSYAPAETLYAVAQALSYVASRRGDLEEARSAQAQIADLMQALQN